MESAIKYLILPSNLIILFLMTGVVLVLARRAKNLATVLLATAAVGYLVFGIGPVSFWLLGNLEHRHRDLVDLRQAGADDVRLIVVLSGYAGREANIPLSSEVNSSTAFRLLEAARIFHAHRSSSIIVTGDGVVPTIMKELLVGIGIAADRIITENASRNTFENAENIRRLVGEQRFFLVTSAGHMPRAMMVFEKQGFRPIAAPTDYMTRENILATGYLPTPMHLAYSDLAVHEYVAILWYRFTGRL